MENYTRLGGRGCPSGRAALQPQPRRHAAQHQHGLRAYWPTVAEADGLLGRGVDRELDAGEPIAAQVEASLGRPNVIRRGPGTTTYWLYTFDHMRHHYLLTFHGEHLAHVRYVPRPGEAR